MQAPCALLLSIVAGALAQLAMKAGLQDMTSMMPTPLLVTGIACYAIAMVSWIFALKQFDLSFAYPMLSLGYLLVYFGAFFWPELGEELTWNKSIGILLITLGVTISTKAGNSAGRQKNERQRTA